MGWVKKEVLDDETIFNEMVESIGNRYIIYRGVAKSGSGSVYEYLTDLIKDTYDVTLSQCSNVAKKVASYFGIINPFFVTPIYDGNHC